MNTRELSDLQIVLLAAGFSSRLGRPKALARLHGNSLIARTVAVLERFTQRKIIVVIPQRATRIGVELRGRRVSLVPNPDRAKGLSASVALGLRKSRYSSATLFVPVDLPELTHADIVRLISRWRSSKRRVVASDIEGRASTPLILPKFLYSQARRLGGDLGFRNLIAELPPEQRILVGLASAARDVDTPLDLADARRRLSNRSPKR
jgi:molybdenum cofactor cytidylyltransferase